MFRAQCDNSGMPSISSAPGSRAGVRALGNRRLAQATAAMVVTGAIGTGLLIAHDASTAQATTDPAGTNGGSTTPPDTGSTSLTPTQNPPDATSGGS